MNRWHPIAIGAAVIALVIGIPLGAIFLVGALKKGTADFRGDVAVTESVKANGAYRIAAYESFFNRCAEIQAKEATIAALKEELVTADNDRAFQIRATLTGVNSGRASDIARYNADARKTDTQASFLASTLPFQIDPTQEKTLCTVS